MASVKSVVVSVFRWLFEIKAPDVDSKLPAVKEEAHCCSEEKHAPVRFDAGSYMLSRI